MISSYKDDKLLYNDDTDDILAGINDRAKESSKEILKKMGKKRMAKKEKKRKTRICERPFFKKGKTIAHFCNISLITFHVLPLFKSFLFIFKQKSPQVHRLHLKLSELTQDLSSCFLQHKSLKGPAGSKLKESLIKNKLRKTKDFFLGSSTEKNACQLHREKKHDTMRFVSDLCEKSFH